MPKPTKPRKAPTATSDPPTPKPGRIASAYRRQGHIDHNGNGHPEGVKMLAEAKAIIVKTIAAGHTPTIAAEEAGVSPTTAYQWRQDDQEFRARWFEAVESKADRGEELLWSHANSQHPGAVTAAIVVNKMSGRFVDTQRIDQRTVTINATVDLSRLTDDQLEDLLALQRGRRALESPDKALPAGQGS